MNILNRAACAIVGVLAAVSGANAADLGGNCCADLEERIAELEATTARKGNRKVSLTISGWVSQQVTYFDDGVEKNAYVSDIGSTLNSNFKLSGSAKITPDLSAGYLLQVEVVGNENLQLSQNKSAGTAPVVNGKGLDVIQSFWFLKSETLGKLSVGTQSSAADNAALLPDGSGTLIYANYIMYDINGFFVRSKRNNVLIDGTHGGEKALSWGSFATCQSFGGALGLGSDCDGVPNNNIRYDTPAFAGFSASVSWGEDDIWATSGRYAGEFAGFKLAAAVGYFETTNDNGDALVTARGGKKASALQAGAYLQHIPTGLFVYGAYGHDYNDVTGGLNGFGQQQKDGENWYVKAGLRQRWNNLGHTVLYGEYGENKNKMSNDMWMRGVTASNLTQWGVGATQEIDAAAMTLFANYRHYEANFDYGGIPAESAAPFYDNITGATAGHYSVKGVDLIKIGAIINF